MMEWMVWIPLCTMENVICPMFFFFIVPMIDSLFPVSRRKISIWTKHLWLAFFLWRLATIERTWLSSLTSGIVYAQAIAILDSIGIFYDVIFSDLWIIMAFLAAWNECLVWNMMACAIGFIVYEISEQLDQYYNENPIKDATDETHGYALGDMILFREKSIVYLDHSRPWMILTFPMQFYN